MKTRTAKWGAGAINALSERLQVELPGLRGFSPQHIRFMRQFYEEWSTVIGLVSKVHPEIRYLPSSETEEEIRYLSSSGSRPLTNENITDFLSIGFTHYRSIFGKCKKLDERWYYISRSAHEQWTVDTLEQHLKAKDYDHNGALPNNFSKTLSPIALATQAVRAFKDEYLLDFMNLDNIDARYHYETDGRVLLKSMVWEI